jgi:D-alanyl-D-alanine carboxypeptidase
LEERMEIRSLRNIWISGLILAVLFITLPNQSFSRTVRTSKSTKSQEARTHQKTQSPKATQAAQTTQGGLQYDAQSVVLMDGLTGQVLYEQNPQLRIAPASFVKILTLYLVFDALRAGQMKRLGTG